MKKVTMFFAAFLLVIACKNNSPEPTTTSDTTPVTTVASPTPELTTTSTSTTPIAQPTQPSVTMPVTAQPTVASQPQPTEPAQNAQGVWHFTCPKGCKGGAGANGPCPKCSTPLVHNQAYHAGATPPPVQAVGVNPTVPTTASTQPQQNPEPAQNAKGVWHFTCPKGCAGGAGTTSACAKCGTTLAHNVAYHQ
jgi:hypothetical protein